MLRFTPNVAIMGESEQDVKWPVTPVSYTHLDVYKRQSYNNTLY